MELLGRIFYLSLPTTDYSASDVDTFGTNVFESDDVSDEDEDEPESESDELEYFIQPNRRTAPLLLTEVSKGWRKTALDTAELWCSLKVCRRIDRNDADHYANEALGVMLRYMQRWELVELHWGRDTAPNLTSGLDIMNMDTSPVPLLEELQIDSFIETIDVNNQIEDQLSFLLRTAPRMAYFAWSDNIVLRGRFWRPLRLNPTGLQELRLGCVTTVPECITIMCNSPQLRMCEFTYVILNTPLGNGTIDVEIPITPTTLHHLVYLKICGRQDLALLFDSITLPALYSMIIENFSEEVSPQLLLPLAEQEFISLFRRSRFPLKELMLNINISAGGLLQTLRLVDESLRTIHLGQNGSGCFTNLVLTSLMRLAHVDGTVSCLCPSLNRISFISGYPVLWRSSGYAGIEDQI
jgi:hypothetical protein